MLYESDNHLKPWCDLFGPSMLYVNRYLYFANSGLDLGLGFHGSQYKNPGKMGWEDYGGPWISIVMINTLSGTYADMITSYWLGGTVISLLDAPHHNNVKSSSVEITLLIAK